MEILDGLDTCLFFMCPLLLIKGILVILWLIVALNKVISDICLGITSIQTGF